MKAIIHFPDKIRGEFGGIRRGTRVFILDTYYRYNSSYGVITVPSGFVTDGASIPRIFWPVLGPHGDYFGAAVIHDYLYSKASQPRWDLDRWECDDVFMEAMFNANVGFKRHLIHRAVRLFGGKSFRVR
jgi:hypothetical protein